MFWAYRAYDAERVSVRFLVVIGLVGQTEHNNCSCRIGFKV